MTTPDSRSRYRRSWVLAAVLAVVALVIPLSITGSAAAHDSNGAPPKPTIVLVHGDWADGSSWSAVMSRLQSQGYTVVAPPNQLRGPSVDAPYLASYLQTIPGPIILVGHSYGGFVITNAATGNTNVKALVYIDAFIPDENQTLASLGSPESCLDPASAFNAVPFNGGVDLYLRIAPNPPYTGFNECFANGVPPNQAACSPRSSVRPPWPNWESRPARPRGRASRRGSLIGTEDHAVPPSLQEQMATHAGAHISFVGAGHLSLITRPNAVVDIIDRAIHATS
jgi:Predicted hydrolases or acyltransferases (alpha/beta hydrolase superfamily)